MVEVHERYVREPRAGRHAEPRARGAADRRGLRRARGGGRRADRARVRDPALAHEDRARPRSCSPPTCPRTRTSRASSSATSRRACGEQFGAQLQRHPLRREIIASRVVNDLVNRAGTTFAFRLADETGARRRRHRARLHRGPRGVRAARPLGRDRGARRARACGDADRDAAQGADPARARDAVAPAQPPQAARHRGDGRPLRARARRRSPRRCRRCSARPSSRPRERRPRRFAGRRAGRARGARRAPRGARADVRARRDRGGGRAGRRGRRQRSTSRSARGSSCSGCATGSSTCLGRRAGRRWRALRSATTSTPSRRV